MQLPFTIAIEAPRGAELRRAARKPWVWIAIIAVLTGIVIAILAYVQVRRTEAVGDATLRVTSDPGDTSVARHPPDRDLRLEPGTPFPSTSAADHRRGLVADAVRRGRRLPRGDGATCAQVLPGTRHDHPGRRRLPGCRTTDGPCWRTPRSSCS